MKRNFFILGFVMFTALGFGQNLLNQPESVEWDHIHGQWLVSNHASGEIITIDDEGGQTIFSDLLSSTRGLKVRGDRLFAASNDGLVIFDLESGLPENQIVITDAVLLNDLDFDDEGNLFVSDYWDNKIYKIDMETLEYELFIDYGIIAPNGLIFDEANSRMLVCGHNGNSSVIHSFDVDTAETELLLYPTFYSLDGFARDLQGNIYISSWHTDAVYKFIGNNINNEVEVAASGLIDPADIFINPYNNILAVPNFSDNSVTFVQLEMPSSVDGNSVNSTPIQILNYPNPFNPSTKISFSLNTEITENTEIEIYNIKGQKVYSFSPSSCHPSVAGRGPEPDEGRGENLIQHKVIWNGTDTQNNPVSSGTYYAVLKQNNQILASHKMLLIK